ncbi:MAG: hypothetical protein J7K33_03095, partial [Candidatus Marinimicrobia bacterium]|nr:hypothetical protein [Candidatus Neomarinimicrobiota bacterium]
VMKCVRISLDVLFIVIPPFLYCLGLMPHLFFHPSDTIDFTLPSTSVVAVTTIITFTFEKQKHLFTRTLMTGNEWQTLPIG